MKLKQQVSLGKLSISRLEKRLNKLKEVLKSHKIEFEDEEVKKEEEKTQNLKRKLSNSGNHGKQTEQPDTKKRKKN